jgi:hypothetical protein
MKIRLLLMTICLTLTGCVTVKNEDGMHVRTTIHPICSWETWGGEDCFLDEIDIFYIPVYLNN